MRKPLIYVAGPISKDPFGCVRVSNHAFSMLRDNGAIPFMPQWSVISEMVRGRDYEYWLEYDFDVIRRCDALFRLYGESPGADREVHFARSLGLPIFDEVHKPIPELIKWIKDFS